MSTDLQRDNYETLVLFMWVTGLWASIIVSCIALCCGLYRTYLLVKQKYEYYEYLWEKEKYTDIDASIEEYTSFKTINKGT